MSAKLASRCDQIITYRKIWTVSFPYGIPERGRRNLEL